MIRLEKLLAPVVAILGAIWLAACVQDGTPGDGAGPSPAFNDTDITFAQQMIVHHQQAIMMAEIAQARAQDARVRQLAARIEADQRAEIQTLTRQLQSWGQPVPSMTPGEMPRMPTPSGTPHMPQMRPEPDMSPMMDMHGAEFDRMFLEMMIPHHEEALTMAQAELDEGVNPQARQVAENIQETQTAEIAVMRKFLEPSPGPS